MAEFMHLVIYVVMYAKAVSHLIYNIKLRFEQYLIYLVLFIYFFILFCDHFSSRDARDSRLKRALFFV